MMSLAVLAVSALLLALLITPACRILCRRYGWVDHPNPRKLHRDPIPRTGGIAIFLGYAAALTLFRFSPLAASSPLAAAAQRIWTVLPAVLVAFATGLLDDLIDLKPWMKVIGQVLAAVLVCVSGVQIRGLAGYPLGGDWWQVPLTVFWLVGCANAFNLIDGVNGLAAGVGLFAAATAFLSALLTGNHALALVTAPPSSAPSSGSCPSTSAPPPYLWAIVAAILSAFSSAVSPSFGRRNPLLSSVAALRLLPPL